MTVRKGPLSPRQARILDGMAAGQRHKEIATTQGLTLGVVRYEAMNAVRKFGAESTAQAMAMQGRAEAYIAAAELLEADIPQLERNGGVDEHVAHVLDGLARTLRDRAAALLPK